MIFSGIVLQEILRHWLISVLIASRLNQVVKPSAKIKTFKESSLHPCLQFQSFTNHLFPGGGVHERGRHFAQSARHPRYSRWHVGGGFRQEIQHVDWKKSTSQKSILARDFSSQTSWICASLPVKVDFKTISQFFGPWTFTWISAISIFAPIFSTAAVNLLFCKFPIANKLAIIMLLARIFSHGKCRL